LLESPALAASEPADINDSINSVALIECARIDKPDSQSFSKNKFRHHAGV